MDGPAIVIGEGFFFFFLSPSLGNGGPFFFKGKKRRRGEGGNQAEILERDRWIDVNEGRSE